jgi:hypothetical protein
VDFREQVLRFYAQWDDRGSMFGQKLDYVINYFLQDDKIEVRFRSKVDGFVPQSRFVNLRIVGQPDWGACSGAEG